ncbi:hypothetical protein PoB_004002700 [Plakobranchus ocellatus]|uniref:Uncharacterized protein n=1 Tax=Plakobranchus ocellatus TaxID=259542 RepID=A0AAV4B1V4_9GAST|nr:hypothetical protein PoB_004002700 [Plakobranchus ocellatus]
MFRHLIKNSSVLSVTRDLMAKHVPGACSYIGSPDGTSSLETSFYIGPMGRKKWGVPPYPYTCLQVKGRLPLDLRRGKANHAVQPFLTKGSV